MTSHEGGAGRGELFFGLASWLGRTARIAGWAAVIVAAVAGMPLPAFPEACQCPKDVADMKARLDEAKLMRRVWQNVLNQAQRTPMTDDRAVQAFDQGTKKKAAKQAGESAVNIRLDDVGWIQWKRQAPFTCVPVVSPEFKAAHCDDIWQAALQHEQRHCDFNTENGVNNSGAGPDPALAVKLGWGGYIASSEVAAYTAEIEFLTGKLAELQSHCGSWRCKCGPHAGQMYESAAACTKACPIGGMACAFASCYEIDPKTGKPTGKKY